MEEAPISPSSPSSPMPEGAPMTPGEASAQEAKENTKQESIDNIVQVGNYFFPFDLIFFFDLTSSVPISAGNQR